MEWISLIASFLHVTNSDVFFIIYGLVLTGGFVAMGIDRIYDCFFGLVAGISIFIVLQVLFFGYTNDLSSSAIMSPAIAKFIVGSSIYLIFILSILTPINGIIHVGGGAKNRVIRILQTFILSFSLATFYTIIIVGLIEKTYLFSKFDSAFSLLKKIPFLANFASESIIYGFLLKNIAWIIILGVGFIIYKLIFGDLVSTMLVTIGKSLFKKKEGGEKKDK